MEDMVLRNLEISAKERKEDVSTIIAKAVKIGIKKEKKDIPTYSARES